MSNQPITDMIETIERYAQLQPDYPVYNVLGEEHTYGQLKADSDSLAAHIDQMGLPEKSPVVVFGGQEYEMLDTVEETFIHEKQFSFRYFFYWFECIFNYPISKNYYKDKKPRT